MLEAEKAGDAPLELLRLRTWSDEVRLEHSGDTVDVALVERVPEEWNEVCSGLLAGHRLADEPVGQAYVSLVAILPHGDGVEDERRSARGDRGPEPIVVREAERGVVVVGIRVLTGDGRGEREVGHVDAPEPDGELGEHPVVVAHHG